MGNRETVMELLKNHTINKARISFIENQIKRFGMENRIYEYGEPDNEKFADGRTAYSDAGRLAGTCSVMENEGIYEEGFADTQNELLTSLKNELNQRKQLLGLVEDALEMLESMDCRYRAIVERYYIKSCRMEEIAEEMHISRSKCYELCKGAVTLLEKVILGNGICIKFENNKSLLGRI